MTTLTTAQIQWSIPRIAYTPEQYTVEYGTSPGSLSQSSAVVSGSTDLAAVDRQYSVEVTGLLEGSTYYYRVVAHNTYGSTSSNVYTFTVENIRKLPGFVYLVCDCFAYVFLWNSIFVYAVPLFEVRVDPSSVQGLASDTITLLCTATVHDSVTVPKTFHWSRIVAGGPPTDLSDNGGTVRITNSNLNASTGTSQLVTVEHSPGQYQFVCSVTLQFPGEMDDISVAEQANVTITGNPGQFLVPRAKSLFPQHTTDTVSTCAAGNDSSQCHIYYLHSYTVEVKLTRKCSTTCTVDTCNVLYEISESGLLVWDSVRFTFSISKLREVLSVYLTVYHCVMQ